MKPILSRRTSCQVVVGEAVERLAVDEDLARRRAIEGADQVQERRLAGARRSDDGDHLAFLDGQADIVERDDAAFAFELLGDVVEDDHEPIL